MTAGNTILENIEYNRLIFKHREVSMFQLFLISAAINTSDACSPAETRAEAFYPIDGSTNVPLDSQLILKASGSSGGFPFTFTLNTDETEVGGEITELCNAGDHWDITCYYIFVPNEPLMPETTYTLMDTSSDFLYLEPSTFNTGTDTSSVATQVPEIELTEQGYNERDDFCGIDAHYYYTVSVSNVVLSDDQNTHLYLNQVDVDGNVIAIERMKAVHQGSVNLSANTNTNGTCFTVSHHHQNGTLIGESAILCADAIDVGDTEGSGFGDEGESADKGCSSANQGAFSWISLLGLIGLSLRNRRNT